jgi:hypothetical protein
LFGDKQIELLTNFARQAVIAIENARLLRELRQRTDDLTEALVYQTGSSNILKVIASSPTEVEPALKAIVDSACEICNAYDCSVVLKDGDDLVVSAHHGPIPPGFTRNPISRSGLPAGLWSIRSRSMSMTCLGRMATILGKDVTWHASTAITPS